MTNLKQKFKMKKIVVFPPGIEPRTLRVLGVRDNYYLTETRALRAHRIFLDDFFFCDK